MRSFITVTFLSILAHMMQARTDAMNEQARKKPGNSTGKDGARDKAFWDDLTQSMQEDISRGKNDDHLRNTKPQRAKAPKSERVYPATAEGQAEKVRDEEAKQSRSFQSYEERMQRAIPESRVKELAGLVRHIRPGVHVDDIDALAAISDGLLTAERLSDSGFWAPDQMPCKIFSSKEGKNAGQVFRVVFPAMYHDPESVAAKGSVEALLAAVPGASRAFVSVREHSNVEKIDLPVGDAGLIARIHFAGGAFTQTEYSFRKRFEQTDRTFAELDERDWKVAQSEFERSGKDARLTLDEKRARLRAPYLEIEAKVGADGALRKWAEGYSAWGESANRWSSFVNWLITESTPDGRHALVEGWNWDHGSEVLRWIIRQPDTDIATVATVIWRTEPSYHISETAKGANGYANKIGLADCDLLMEIADKIRAGFYRPRDGHAPIAFKPPAPLRLGRDDDAIRQAKDRLLPPVVRAPIAGRPVSDLAQRVPARFGEILM